MSRRRDLAGLTLVETLVVAAIMGLVLGAGIPRATVAFEEARVDAAGATLRSIWSAQRMYWLEQRTFTARLQELVDWKLLDKGVPEVQEPFRFEMRFGDQETWGAVAIREGSATWQGRIQINEWGDITGAITDGTRRIQPAGAD